MEMRLNTGDSRVFYGMIDSHKENPFEDFKQGRDVIKCTFQKGSFSGHLENKAEGIQCRQDGQLGCHYNISRKNM